MCLGGIANAAKALFGIAKAAAPAVAATAVASHMQNKATDEANKRADAQAEQQQSALADASRRAKGQQEADSSSVKNEKTDALSEAVRTTARGLAQDPQTKKKKLGQ